MDSASRFLSATRTLAWGVTLLIVFGVISWQGARASESATSTEKAGSRVLKIRKRDGKKLTLHDWTLEGDTLRGTHEVWVDYERVQKAEAFALSEVTLRDGNLEGDSLRRFLEAMQGEAAADQDRAGGAEPAESVAQQAKSSAPAARIRLRLDDAPETWLHGVFLKSSPESLWLVGQGVGDTLAVARTGISRIQMLDGRT